MEYFDVLDENGHTTGETKERREIHRDGDWHKSVDIWVINNKKELLLQKRAHEKESYPDLWEVSCSGHVDAGERSINAALRELKEELGVHAEKENLKFLFESKESHTTNNGTFINNEFKEVYMLELSWDIDKFKLKTDEVSEVKFIYFEKLEEMLKSDSKEFVPHGNVYDKFFEIINKLLK